MFGDQTNGGLPDGGTGGDDGTRGVIEFCFCRGVYSPGGIVVDNGGVLFTLIKQ